MVSLDIETREGLRRVSLDKPRLTIGRLPGNDIVLPFTSISRHHAEVRQRGQDWWISDLGSTNGLRINGTVIREHLLHPGDMVVLAPNILVHFVDTTVRTGVVEGSTIPLPAVTIAPPSVPPPTHSSTMPPPVANGPSAVQLAAAAAMPLPRRHARLTAPPSTSELAVVAIPSTIPLAGGTIPAYGRPSPPGWGDSPAAPMPDPEDWLNDMPSVKVAAYPPTGVMPPPLPTARSALPGMPAPPQAAPSLHAPIDLPLSSPFALMRQKGDPLPVVAQRPLLYTCAICGERTAPDSPYCWSCHSTIAQPCLACHLYLLPIQAKCSRCATPNPHTVRK